MIILEAAAHYSITLAGTVSGIPFPKMAESSCRILQSIGRHVAGNLTPPFPRIVPMQVTPSNETLEIISVVDDGDGKAQFETSTAHDLLADDGLIIQDTVHYNGDQVVTDVLSLTSFVADVPYIAPIGTEDLGKCSRKTGFSIAGVMDNGEGLALFATSTPHRRTVGASILIQGTVLYDGNKIVTKVLDEQHFETGQKFLGPAVGTGSTDILVSFGSLVFTKATGISQIQLPTLISNVSPYAFNEYGHAIWFCEPPGSGYSVDNFAIRTGVFVARVGYWDFIPTWMEL